jgi:hypothetical protein
MVGLHEHTSQGAKCKPLTHQASSPAATRSGEVGGKTARTGKSCLFSLNLDSLSVTQYT